MNVIDPTDLLVRLIQCETVNTGAPDSGNEVVACAALRDWFAERVPDARAETIEAAPGRGNFVIDWPAGEADTNDAEPALLFLGHLDVVPAGDPAMWRHPPFSGTIDGGRVYGRGAIDCKSLVAAQAAAIAGLAASGPRPRGGKRLRMIAGADEEAGGALGFGWLARERPELLRADFAINEGGGRPLNLPDGSQAWLIGQGEKGRYEIHATIRGRSTHPSAPWNGVNPIAHAAPLLAAVDSGSPGQGEFPPVDGLPIFECLPELLGVEGPIGARNLDAALDRVRERDPGLANNLRVISRMTLSPTIVVAGGKSNAIPDTCRVTIDARLPIGADRAALDDVLAELARLYDHSPATIEFEVVETAVASSSPWHDAVAERFSRALAAATATDDPAVMPRVFPGCCTGFTDSRFVRSVGTPVYGFQPKAPDTDPAQNDIHCVGENAAIRDVRFLADALRALAIECLDLV